MHSLKYNKIQFMVSINSYMFGITVPSSGSLLKQRITNRTRIMDLCSVVFVALRCRNM